MSKKIIYIYILYIYWAVQYSTVQFCSWKEMQKKYCIECGILLLSKPSAGSGWLYTSALAEGLWSSVIQYTNCVTQCVLHFTVRELTKGRHVMTSTSDSSTSTLCPRTSIGASIGSHFLSFIAEPIDEPMEVINPWTYLLDMWVLCLVFVERKRYGP